MVKKQEKINKNDFIKLDYIGKVKDGEIFDTNIKKQAEKIGLNIKERPLAICVGQGMILSGIDEFLLGKETGKYNLELKSEKAFGKRKREMIRTMPMSVFSQHKISPRRGMVLNFDSAIGKVSAVSGGRVIVDFNNPLAGKDVEYDLNVKEKIKDEKEKARVLIKSFFRNDFEFEIKQGKIIISLDKKQENVKKFIEIFKDKFKEILNLDLEIQVKESDEKGVKENNDSKKSKNR